MLGHLQLSALKNCFQWVNLLDLKASPTNSALAVQMKSILKGSGASKYHELRSDFTLKEHFIHTTH